MFGPDRGIIESGGDGVGQFDLAFFVRQQKSFRSLQDAEPSALESRSVFARADSFAASLDADHAHMSILQKRMEQTDCVRAAADAGDEQIWQAFFAFENLPARFNADHALKIANHHRIGMRAEDRAQYI